MKETIAEIRELLSQLEGQADHSENAADFRALSGLELPDIICDVVDLLFPELKPYELVLYMYLLRHSIIETGSPYVRVSIRNLQTGVFKSAYAAQSKDGASSYAAMRNALAGLIKIAAIRQEGEPNRDGTLYRVLLPEEIEVCGKHRAETVKNTSIAATEAEADFYNVRENRVKITSATTTNVVTVENNSPALRLRLTMSIPVAEGGGNSSDNLVTACLSCNARKNSRPLGDFMAAQR